MLPQQFFCLFQMRQGLLKFIPLYIFDSIMPVCDIFQIIERYLFIQPVHIPALIYMYIIIQPLYVFHPDIRVERFVH